jgi:transcriptional regulator with XRE-family HTH domain
MHACHHGCQRPGQEDRRVPGLRREEVALLAGVSSDYYVRLEQGRDRHPSDQVLLAIARALQLDEDATAYLLQLAKPPIPGSKRTRSQETVSDGIRTRQRLRRTPAPARR